MCLEALIKSGRHIAGVVVRDENNKLSNRFIRPCAILWYRILCMYYGARPDKWFSSEELLARDNKIHVFKIKDIHSVDFIKSIQSLKPAIIVVGGGWHQRIPAEILRIPEYGCINIHPSLLPEYRGTSVHIWQILNGVSKSGATIHYMDEDFDTGDIIAQQEVEITIMDRPYNLARKVSLISAPLLVETLKRIELGSVEPKKQDVEETQYYHKWKWTEENLVIPWHKCAFDIHNLVRASIQYDYRLLGAFTHYKGDILKVWETELPDDTNNTHRPVSPGTILDIIEGKGLLMSTGKGEILIKYVQENHWWSRSVRADKFCRRKGISIGECLNS
jgi:methionyl-tRNA formyltransferase